MKNSISKILIAFISIFIISCEDDNLMISSPEGTFKINTPENGGSVILNVNTPTNPGISVTWSAMNYTTQTAVTYTVQIAKDGTNFATPIDLGTTNNLNFSSQMADFNIKCLTAGAVPFVQSALNVRIKASTGTTGSQTVYSNTINYLVTTYGCLNQYAVGSALPQSGWNWNAPRVLLCNDGVLTMTADFEAGTDKAFRFFTQEGVWGSGRNYPYYTTNNFKIVSVLTNAGDGDSNFKFNGANGKYKLTLNENNKTINITKRTTNSELEPTSDWLVGAATPGGWSWAGNNETEFGEVNTGIYEVIVKLNTNETFRVFLGNNGGDSWDLGSRNFPWYVNNNYTIDNELVNANDGDSNFRYTGPTGIRTFRINSNTKVVEVL